MSKLSELQSRLPAWMKTNLTLNLITLLLWVISAAFSFYVMAEFQHMLLRRFVIYWENSRWGFQVFRQWSTIFWVAAWLGFVIITGEYHYQHLRQSISWKVFKWSFLVLLIVLAVALIL
jgi:hypothetical protein